MSSFLFGIRALEQRRGIDTVINELFDALNGAGTVGSVGDAEPLGGGVEDFAGSSAVVDELIHHEGDKELSLEVGHVLRVGEELLEVRLAVGEVVGREAPHIHADGHVSATHGHPLFAVLVADLAVDGVNLGALHDVLEVAVGIGVAHAACHAAILRERVAHAEAHHGILALAAFGEVGQELADGHEGVAVVEVVAVDDTEGLLDDVLTHQHGVVRTPGLYAAFRNLEACGQVVEGLEAELTGHVAFVLLQNLVAELVFEVATDDPHDFAKASLNGIVDGVVHDGFTIGAERIKLLQTTITAAHAGSKKKEGWFHLFNVIKS